VNYVALAVVAALLTLVIVMLARRSRPDTAGDFRRQIDALSSESRRPVVDQVSNLETRNDDTGESSQSPQSREVDPTDGP
jgi:hypothetical protein